VIEGMAQGFKRSRLVVVGDGPAVPDLIALAGKLRIAERVQFCGLVPPETVAEYVMTFDIALQPSATPYASPLKIFDYMAAGCAIVAPEQPNIREILAHESTALLFDATVPGALWQSVERLIADRDLRVKLGDAARAELLEKNYTWAGNAARVSRLALER
jgi:glycosyltransferase involved in cell wall biosynthesis